MLRRDIEKNDEDFKLFTAIEAKNIKNVSKILVDRVNKAATTLLQPL